MKIMRDFTGAEGKTHKAIFRLHIRQVLLQPNQIEAHIPFEFCVHFTILSGRGTAPSP